MDWGVWGVVRGTSGEAEIRLNPTIGGWSGENHTSGAGGRCTVGQRSSSHGQLSGRRKKIKHWQTRERRGSIGKGVRGLGPGKEVMEGQGPAGPLGNSAGQAREWGLGRDSPPPWGDPHLCPLLPQR